jgi:hypothetical protein
MKILNDDQLEYKKDIEKCRKRQNSYVITDRELIHRAENLMMRKNIVWT